jgi:hypothetical protein
VIRLRLHPEKSKETQSLLLPRLATVERLDDVTDVLHEEFLRWFGHGVAGRRDVYEAPARQIWDAVVEYRQSETLG